MSYKIQLTNLQNVAPGNIATLTCPAGPGSPTFDKIKLVLSGGMTPAHIEWVRGKADGRIFFDELGGTVLQARDAYKGLTTSAAVVNLDFTEPHARNGATEQLLSSIPGALLKSLTFEIKIAAGAPGGGRIKAVASYRPPTSNPWILKRINATQAFPSAGTESAPNIMYLPTGASGGQIKRIWIHEDTPGSIDGASIRIAQNVIHEVTRAEVEEEQSRNDLVPQAGIFVLDFIEDGNLAGRLDTSAAPNVELRLVGDADSYQVFYELIDPISRL